jgi:hypothetical protein
MLFKIRERSEISLFQNNWDRGDCCNDPNDFTVESKCWIRSYFFSRHFSWGDDFSLNGSWGHWSGYI